jgi:hypothetical protein
MEEMAQSNPDDENMEDILEFRDKQIEDQLKELNLYQTKLEMLEKELTSSKKFLATQTKAAITTKTKFARLHKLKQNITKN